MNYETLKKEAEKFIHTMSSIKKAIGPLTYRMVQAQIVEQYVKILMKKYTIDQIFTILFIIDAYQDN